MRSATTSTISPGSRNGWGAAVAEARDLKCLTPDQAAAANPLTHAWVSASAGTGKTQVLTARVLRLLLAGANPAAILCITFTKAGAAEMAERLNERLARWVRCKDAALASDLKNIGEDWSEPTRARARTLFARVLDAPGGLRIQTIHAFAGSLLASFPVEAGVTPGFTTLDERSTAVLRDRVLADGVVTAERDGDAGLIADLEALGVRMGEGGATELIGRMMADGAMLDAFTSRESIAPRLKRFLGVPAEGVDAALEEACGDAFDRAALLAIADANHVWDTKTSRNYCEIIANWLALPPAGRAANLDSLLGIVCTGKGEQKAPTAGQLKADPDYATHCDRLREKLLGLIDLRERAAVAERLAGTLRVGWTLGLRYREEKRRLGAVDYDDMIAHAARLLDTEGMGAWVRYKLDQRIDHILVDEAQDTNQRQWTIARRLTEEYFAAENRPPDRRTLFAVGDFKQAIFSFQGTDPVEFRNAQMFFHEAARRVRDELSAIDLATSFRSTGAVLELVDGVLESLGHQALGLDAPIPRHDPHRATEPGEVLLLPPVSVDNAADDAPAGEEDWLADADRLWAERLASQIGRWLSNSDPLILAARGRRLRPEDILILVRSRGEFTRLLVARLHEAGVPVSGVDRLRLTQPLAVRDLLALVRFALQPDDDLTLASLLVSPLLGWSQDALFELAHGRSGTLWSRLRDGGQDRERAAVEWLGAVLNLADFVAPHEFFETILSGPLGGRARLLARLGEEARDPIDELLNAALQFESANAPSLQMFLDWIERDDVDVKRDPSQPRDAVRIMTVHGAKGLQAPLVILADATKNPENNRPNGVAVTLGEGEPEIFLPLYQNEARGPLAQAWASQSRRAREEHWRLMYVALTRAEDVLVVGGALGSKARGVAPPESWHARVGTALAALGGEAQDDPHWPGIVRHARGGSSRRVRESRRIQVRHALPPALLAPPPEEPVPPRPLAPSALGIDDVSAPPFGLGAADAARRGVLLHALFERLPALPPEARTAAATRWLDRPGRAADAAERDALIGEALAVMDAPDHAAFFVPDALAEAPVAATVDGLVVQGTVDRLVVEANRVRFVDFKTGGRVPAAIDDVPVYHLRQMAAYAAALARVFPNRTIEAALLYTAGPRLLVLPPPLIAAHKPGLPRVEQSFGGMS
jgi:ATP-dependent helicase/nuclease subunit A